MATDGASKTRWCIRSESGSTPTPRRARAFRRTKSAAIRRWTTRRTRMKQPAKKQQVTVDKSKDIAGLAAASCSACGLAWTDHLGIMGTCQKLERARSALKVICTWASFRDGECLTPKDTEKLCRKALSASAPNDQAHLRQPDHDSRKELK